MCLACVRLLKHYTAQLVSTTAPLVSTTATFGAIHRVAESLNPRSVVLAMGRVFCH